MRKLLSRSALLVVLMLVAGGAAQPPATAVQAATPPCFAASCDGVDPLTVATTCGPFVAYGGASGDTTTITILYSRACHAAYVELRWTSDPGANVPQTGVYFYQPQYGGPEQLIGKETISSTVQYSKMVNWDYSIKGCFNYGSVGLAQGDPDASSTPPERDYCTRWS